MSDSATPRTAAHQDSLSFPGLTQTHVHGFGDTIQPFHSLLPPSPPALYLSQHQGLFQWVGSSHQVTKVFGASASVLPMNIQGWYPLGLTALISLLSKGCFDLLAVQGTFKSLLQHHNSKVLILWCSSFFMVQLSHPYMTTGKTIALTIWTFVSKVVVSAF